jgi:tripartite-type tricarboxylate transporter receptor subunit TctC
MDRRTFVIGSAAAAAAASGAALVAGRAIAEDAYPAHAITFVSPFPPGGIADVIGRPLAAARDPVVKHPVVKE